MTRLRSAIAPLAAAWLFCQIGTVVASVPLVFWITAADPHAEECTCGHADGVMCPMHHKPFGRPTPCAMHAANSSGAAVVTTFVGVAGLTPEPTLSIRPADSSLRSLPGDVREAGERPVPPDPPPPRI